MAVLTETQRINQILSNNAGMTLEDIILIEIDEWHKSDDFKLMLTSDKYIRNCNDIKKRKRVFVDKEGETHEEKKLANNRLAHNFFWKLIAQKSGYLLSKPFAISTDNDVYHQLLSEFCNEEFRRNLKDIGEEAIQKGRAWCIPCYDEEGNFKFKKIPSEQILPLWTDAAHTKLDAFIRVYGVITYVAKIKKVITKVEYWDTTGVRLYELKSGTLIPDQEHGLYRAHFYMNGKPYNWQKVPIVCFKYNKHELSLLRFVKDHIDDYDRNKSDNSNNLEDLPNFIYVLTNYDGTNLGEFRKNLSLYRAVKVTEDGMGRGGVATISAPVETESVKTQLEIDRRDIFECGFGVDTTSDKFTSPNEITIRSLYGDLDMDCNNIELEFKTSLQELLWFLNVHLYNSGTGDFFNAKADFVFNRDIIVFEDDVIRRCKDNVGILSDETNLENHPWVKDVKQELERKRQEKEELESFELPELTEYNFEKDPEESVVSDEDTDTSIKMLNGEQIASLLQIVRAVKSGELSRKAAISLVTSSLGVTNAEVILEEQL